MFFIKAFIAITAIVASSALDSPIAIPDTATYQDQPLSNVLGTVTNDIAILKDTLAKSGEAIRMAYIVTWYLRGSCY